MSTHLVSEVFSLPSNLDEISENPLFDDPDADIILRSCDAQEFRVFKVYIIKCSPVLSKKIRTISGPSDNAISTGPDEKLLPILHLPDNGAIISSLLTFIFPVPPVLPSTVEETMQLLSVAQMYEMGSVLTHMRAYIATLQDPLIQSDNAFRGYSLACDHGLRPEVVQAARITLKSPLTIENLEGKLDVMPGSHLYELRRYHQRVKANLSSNVDEFRESGDCCGPFQGLSCEVISDGIPKWIKDYIYTLVQDPSCFDLIQFQLALTQHVGSTGTGRWKQHKCSDCTSLPEQTIRKFWTALTTFVHENMEKADSIFSISKENLSTEDIIHSPTATPPLPESLDISGADIIIQSSDLVNFRIHKSILVSSSPFFRDMFSLPQPSDNETIDGLTVVRFSEDAELIRALITVLYPIPSEIPTSYDRVLALLATTQKYNMAVVQSSIRAEISRGVLPIPVEAQPFRAYAIAFSNMLSPEIESAARLTLDYPLTFKSLGKDLLLFKGSALRELVSFRKKCRDKVVSCLKSFLDTRDGPSKIWVGCCKSNDLDLLSDSEQSLPDSTTESDLPLWLRGFLIEQIKGSKPYFTKGFINPCSIRKKYVAALLQHSPRSDGCSFCLRVHARGGDRYCAALEQKLADARNQSLTFI